MEVYGFGTIGDYLVIQKPEPKDQRSDSMTGGMANETATANLTWANLPKESQLAGVDPVLIAWGVDASADILCWDASSDDPVNWPILVCNTDDMMWRRYDCGMVDFLLSLLRADFDECPLGGTNICGVTSVTFLTPDEEERLLAAGLDPWTGEPDPYAGMYPH